MRTFGSSLALAALLAGSAACGSAPGTGTGGGDDVDAVDDGDIGEEVGIIQDDVPDSGGGTDVPVDPDVDTSGPELDTSDVADVEIGIDADADVETDQDADGDSGAELDTEPDVDTDDSGPVGVCDGDPHEPNDSRLDATDLLPEALIDDLVAVHGNEDWFQLRTFVGSSAPYCQDVYLEIQPPGGGAAGSDWSLSLELWAPWDQDDPYAVSNSGSHRERVVYEAQGFSAGTFYAVVRNQIEDACTPYEIYWSCAL